MDLKHRFEPRKNGHQDPSGSSFSRLCYLIQIQQAVLQVLWHSIGNTEWDDGQ